MLRFESRVQKLLDGAFDVHIHSAPDVFPRILNDIDIAQMAKEQGMAGILIKNHLFSTAERAAITSQVTNFSVFGGIVLNLYVGGLNLMAVEGALKLGAKEVWLPTIHAAHYLEQKNHVPTLAKELNNEIKGIYLLENEQNIVEELYPIFKKIAEYNVALGTGHISVKEAKAVVREAAKLGINKIIITHPLATFVNYSCEDLKELLDNGATFIEHVFNDVTRQVTHPISVKKIAENIKAIGAKYIIMSTDSGQWLNPIPAQQMGIFIKEMLDSGISEKEIRTMVSTNPSRMLGI